MKVSISHSEKKTGLFRKSTHYIVALQVVFSEEEKAIIQERDLRYTTIMERNAPSTRPKDDEKFPDIHHLTISKLLDGKPDEYALSNPALAKEYEDVLRAQLPHLKKLIEDNAAVDRSDDSFEL